LATGLVLLAAAPALADRAAPAVDLVWPADAQPRVPIIIKRTALTARVALGFDKAMLLNGEPAARARLKMFPLIGKKTVKNSMIPGGEATFRGNLYGVSAAGAPETDVPVAWVDKTVAEDADGVMSVMAINADRVTLTKRPPAPGSVTYTMTRPGEGDTLMKVRIGEETVRIGFDLRSPNTVMNRRAAVALEETGVVRRLAKVGLWSPIPLVALPVEELRPQPGARVAGLPLYAPTARISESRAKEIDAQAKAGTSTAADEADTITVTAQKKKGADPWLLFGRDVLDHCSRIELDRPAKVWRLTCLFPPN
jgi:hypothetical protein